MMKEPVRVGIAGLGRMGENHNKILGELAAYFTLIGAYEPSSSGSSPSGVKFFPNFPSLLNECDAVIIAAPTREHEALIEMALTHGKQVLVEKPAVANADAWRRLAAKNLQGWENLMVGHIERFNPAFREFQKHATKCQCITSQRIAPFSTRGADVSVVWDLLIHDLDLVLAIFNEKPEKITANGMGGVGSGVDFITVQLTFSGKRFAQLTAARTAPESRREISFIQSGTWGKADLIQRKFWKATSTQEGTVVHEIPVPEGNALKNELQHWHACIIQNCPPATGVSTSNLLMEVCEAIENQIHL